MRWDVHFFAPRDCPAGLSLRLADGSSPSTPELTHTTPTQVAVTAYGGGLATWGKAAQVRVRLLFGPVPLFGL
jgi:hypothetical protein